MSNAPLIFAIDDEKEVLGSLASLLGQKGYEVETYSSAQEFLDGADLEQGACVIADVCMPGLDGLQLQNALRQARTPLPMIFITAYGDIPMAVRSMKAGAVDFLEKPLDPDLLLASLRSVTNPQQEKRPAKPGPQEVREKLGLLTPREVEVLKLLIEGRQSQQIANELAISRRTVEVHRGHIGLKLGTRNLAGLVRFGIAAGIIDIDRDTQGFVSA